MATHPRGALYVFEGPDGVGKSELAKRFYDALRVARVDCELLSFPGRRPGTLGNLVYRIHHDRNSFGVEKLSLTALQALHVAAHIDAVETSIVPALDAGRSIVLDRFWWSTRIYGAVGGAKSDVVNELIRAELESWGGTIPSAVFLILRHRPLREEPLVDWLKWTAEYKRLALLESQAYPVHTIENNGAIDAALAAILEAVGISS